MIRGAMLRLENLVHFFAFHALVPGEHSQPRLGWAGLALLALWLPWALFCLSDNNLIMQWLGFTRASDPIEFTVVRTWIGLVLPYLSLWGLMRLRLTG